MPFFFREKALAIQSCLHRLQSKSGLSVCPRHFLYRVTPTSCRTGNVNWNVRQLSIWFFFHYLFSSFAFSAFNLMTKIYFSWWAFWLYSLLWGPFVCVWKCHNDLVIHIFIISFFFLNKSLASQSICVCAWLLQKSASLET